MLLKIKNWWRWIRRKDWVMVELILIDFPIPLFSLTPSFIEVWEHVLTKEKRYIERY